MTDQDETQDQQPQSEGDAEAMARLREEINKLPVSEHLQFMLQSLSTLAIGRLGLTGDTAGLRDPAQARLAIDAFKALLGVLEGASVGPEIALHRGMLSQLQLAYAGAMEAGAPASKPAEEAPEKTAPPEEPSADRAPAAEEAASAKATPKKPAATKKPTMPKKPAATKKATKKPAASKQTAKKASGSGKSG